MELHPMCVKMATAEVKDAVGSQFWENVEAALEACNLLQ